MGFLEKYQSAVRRNNSLLCVGLDPDPRCFPPQLQSSHNPMLAFLREIVAATRDLVCAYKPNIAFFGAHGLVGWEALQGILRVIPRDIPVVLDFKANDIGNTARQYARMAYELLGVDAVTVNPLMGSDAIRPFLSYQDRCAFLLCLTSNEGSSDILRLRTDRGVLYRVLAEKAVEWSQNGPCGLVVGATHPDELKSVRGIAPTLPFLIPGVGAQGGEAAVVVQNGCDALGSGILVNASRSILYASAAADFAESARTAAESLRTALNRART